MTISVEILEQICDTRRAGSQSSAQVEIEIYDEQEELLATYLAYQGSQNRNWLFFRLMQAGLPGGMSRLFEKAPADHPFRHVKFHITLPEVDKLNPGSEFARGFELVSSILIRRQVASFKVLEPALSIEQCDYQQRGKGITIFASGNPGFARPDWIAMLVEIDVSLKKAGVKPGLRPETDPGYARAETGILSQFVSYRVTEGDDPLRLQVDKDAQPGSKFTL